jgi:hypothetical protein
MAKPTKQMANYRLPDVCCGTCDNSERNTYDDPSCYKLEATQTIIDIGGVCDMHTVNGVPSFPDRYSV